MIPISRECLGKHQATLRSSFAPEIRGNSLVVLDPLLLRASTRPTQRTSEKGPSGVAGALLLPHRVIWSPSARRNAAGSSRAPCIAHPAVQLSGAFCCPDLRSLPHHHVNVSDSEHRLDHCRRSGCTTTTAARSGQARPTRRRRGVGLARSPVSSKSPQLRWSPPKRPQQWPVTHPWRAVRTAAESTLAAGAVAAGAVLACGDGSCGVWCDDQGGRHRVGGGNSTRVC